ncbi:MAG: two-component sensor histidine kinase [Panacagrimonas sp.]|jgi:signal transduction histidine kinase|nr:HAMP domain-containing sensor histidine kinase [Panacagrimonas sp.]MCC2656989.1 two-component sensor histidine kinase [Panacagrimonas sp.]
MSKPRRFHAASFRFTALTAGVFALGALLYSAVVYQAVSSQMEQQLRAHVAAETSQLLGDYEDHGVEELRHDIRERLERAPTPRLLYTLANPDGVRVFDRIALPAEPGWSRIERAGAPDLILLTTDLPDGFRLAVAAEARSVSEFALALRKTTILQLCALAAIGLAMGMVLSRRFLTRVERLRRAAEAVGRGELSARIPVRGAGDDFEQVALEINRMLGRIEALVGEVRLVSINIAHDLRTPLAAVRQRLERLSELQADEPSRRLCADALQSLDDALQIFSALLRIAEIESGRAQMRSETLDLAELLRHLHDTFEPVAEEHGQKLELEAASGVMVRGDAAMLTQLFVNLVENAIRHNAPGVRIRLIARESPAGPVAEVIDDGIGIPASAIEDVVKPFFRVERSRQAPGSGLGLCLAARIAERHGTHLELGTAHPGLRARVQFAALPIEQVSV